MTTGPRIRRVITGHDDHGRAVILADDIAPNTFASPTIPGFGATVPWLTSYPVDHVTDRDPAGVGTPIPTFPGRCCWRVRRFPIGPASTERTRCVTREECWAGLG